MHFSTSLAKPSISVVTKPIISYLNPSKCKCHFNSIYAYKSSSYNSPLVFITITMRLLFNKFITIVHKMGAND